MIRLHRANITLAQSNKKKQIGEQCVLLTRCRYPPPLRVHSTSTRAKKQHTLAGAVVEHLVPTNGISSSLDLCCVVLQQQRMETKLLKQKQQKTNPKRHPNTIRGGDVIILHFFLFIYFLLLQKGKRKNIPDRKNKLSTHSPYPG